MNEIINIYINLLNEGTPTMRPTTAVNIGNGLYKILPTNDYDPEDETWEFLPDSIVRLKEAEGHFSGKILLAVESI